MVLHLAWIVYKVEWMCISQPVACSAPLSTTKRVRMLILGYYGQVGEENRDRSIISFTEKNSGRHWKTDFGTVGAILSPCLI